ncbi:hypothetical protein CASFOL_000743 [Castilleja foliolosa]|uniref:MADS-box domain-containing protein n=1 Tax=Castilleja foliolosa TaxID=1961234 RepID=A0ABD3EL78_9LAMI
MGRAKLNMELIADKKSRNRTFNTRKEGLIKKIHELKTLCDVKVCMIIYGPKQETGFIEPEIWPPNIDQVRCFLTDIYKPTANKNSGSNKTVGLCDFFSDRKRKIEGDLAKLRKKNVEAKYPARPEIMNIMTEAGLREFAAYLRNKSGYVKSRIEFLRRNKEGWAQSHDFYNPPGLQRIESHIIQHDPTIDHNAMMMLLMNANNDHCVKFAGDGPKPLAQHYGTSLTVQGARPYIPVVAPPVGPYMQMMPVPPQWSEQFMWMTPESDN